jgi:hypothetical protein
VVLAFQSRTTPPAPAGPAASASGPTAPSGGEGGLTSGGGPTEDLGAIDAPPSPADVPPAPAESGELAPPLGSAAPKTVIFGAVIVEYRGAQGVPRTARTKEEAATLAKEIAAVAKDDFAKAVTRGDKGSLENLGTMPRGVFEPLVEYALFSLGVGEVSAPIDSPRGFYVFKRIE